MKEEACQANSRKVDEYSSALVAKHKEQHLAKVDSEGGSPTTTQRREKRKSKECLWGIYSNMCGYDSNGHLSGVL